MIIIRDASGLENKIDITYNPFSDLVMALELLCGPEKQLLHLEWATDVLNSLSRRDRIKLLEIREIFGSYLLMDAFLKDLTPKTDNPIDEFLDHINNIKNWKEPEGAYNPQEIIPFISYMWETYVKPILVSHWREIQKQIEEGRGYLREGRYRELLEKINERIKLTNNTLKMQKRYEMDVTSDQVTRFHISPLIFVFPYLLMDWEVEYGYFFLGWEAPFKGEDSAAKGIDIISSRSFALSDKSRLRMLLLLSNKPMTQKDLGLYMGFAKSTTSKHVNILLNADILKREEVDKTIYLSVNRDILKNLSSFIMDWLQ